MKKLNLLKPFLFTAMFMLAQFGVAKQPVVLIPPDSVPGDPPVLPTDTKTKKSSKDLTVVYQWLEDSVVVTTYDGDGNIVSQVVYDLETASAMGIVQ